MGCGRRRSRAATALLALLLAVGAVHLGACSSVGEQQPSSVVETEGAPGDADVGVVGDAPAVPPAPVGAGATQVSRADVGATGSPVLPEADEADLTTDEALVGTYAAELPAADGPGRILQLDLSADAVAQLTSDYRNGEPPIIEIGSWQSYDDGTLTVVLTTRIGGEPEGVPTAFVLAVDGDSLVAIDYDSSAFGGEGLTFVRQVPQ